MSSSFHVLWDLLLVVAQAPEAGQILCIVDALDECEEHERNSMIRNLISFASVLARKGARLEFLVTSRPYADIEHQFGHLTIRLAGEDEADIIQQEIEAVIKVRLPQVATELRLNTATQGILEQRLLNTQHRTYLWLHLILEDVIKQILGVKTPRRMESLLARLPSTVAEAYEHMLERSPQPQRARRLFHIILAAERPLTLREMNVALNIEEGNSSRDAIDLDDEEDFPRHIKNICGLFVSIHNSKVYFLHQTAKKFLVAKGNTVQKGHQSSMSAEKWKHSMEPEASHQILTEICLTYLLFDEFEDNPLDSQQKELIRGGESLESYDHYLRDFNHRSERGLDQYCDLHDFFEYSAAFWMLHFGMAKADSSNLQWWMRLCNLDSDRFCTWFHLHRTVDHTGEDFKHNYLNFPKPFNCSLILASYLGHDAMVEHILKDGNVDLTGADGTDALVWATVNEHESTVRLLLEAGATHVMDNQGRTPLSIAAYAGSGSMVNILLEQGAEVDLRDDSSRTSLMLAAKEGRLEVVKLLLKAGAALASVDGGGRNILHYAAEGGGRLMVQLLLEKGAVFDMVDAEGVSPLSDAADIGDTEVVELLIARGATFESLDPLGRSPLSRAAQYGDVKLVDLLVARGANVDSIDTRGRSPLSHAAGLIYIACPVAEIVEDMVITVKALLKQGAVVDLVDGDGRTPLSYAAEKGWPDIVKVLLQADASVHAADLNDLTLRAHAVWGAFDNTTNFRSDAKPSNQQQFEQWFYTWLENFSVKTTLQEERYRGIISLLIGQGAQPRISDLSNFQEAEIKMMVKRIVYSKIQSISNSGPPKSGDPSSNESDSGDPESGGLEE